MNVAPAVDGVHAHDLRLAGRDDRNPPGAGPAWINGGWADGEAPSLTIARGVHVRAACGHAQYISGWPAPSAKSWL